MGLDRTRTLHYIKTFNLKPLFVEELGWDNPDIRQPIPLLVDTQPYSVIPLAKKAGMLAFNYSGIIPERKIRLKIYRELAKLFHEHLLIFTDPTKTTQRWLWIKRTAGRPDAARESAYYKGQDGELLFQKLSALAFTLAEEEAGVTISDAVQKTKKAFDVDNITRKFYDRFKTEHASFLKFIEGIPGQSDREWYASLMLNRLMFVYFIQKKGFLDGDTAYLGNRLQKLQAQFGNDQFHSFYREFLLKLFHDGLGNQQRSPELEALLGKVPYLNGGLFDVHQLERENRTIQIPDDAFRRIFDFFDDYQWHLDERPLRNDREINPDVLGYIFEKYINQKQMGAYYTKEDITEYIAKNTIIPFLFDRAKDDCEIAFTPGGVAWSLLVNDPHRYLYEAVKKGTELELPPEIAAGLNNVAERGGWNKPAPAEYALPTEIWREVVARRQRYTEIKTKLQAGELTSINDLITYNLNIRQFAQDVIESSEGPELVRAFYKAISRVTVLDPTCGSGAFLFAALNILEPLYSGCLERMQELVGEADTLNQPTKYPDFRKTLADMTDHLNPRYFVLKSIIINNLYGVDIMEEAVEIAKLRLFLKLAAQVEATPAKANYGIEPLPDIDFNIRAGNTLVGFASLDEVNRTIDRKFDFDNMKGQIAQKAQEVERGFNNFRTLQTSLKLEGGALAQGKQQLRETLTQLNETLNRYLASEYGIDQANIPSKKELETRYHNWKNSHQPFHWCVEYYTIMHEGGFDVIIGNPPYVEYSKVRNEYTLLENYSDYSTNLYSACCYRAVALKNRKGYSSFIVPVSLPSTDRMQALRDLLCQGHKVYNANFSTRPSKLFDGAEQRLTIYIQSPAEISMVYSGGYLKWSITERTHLFSCLEYVEVQPIKTRNNIWPKVRGKPEQSIFQKMLLAKSLANSRMLGSGTSLYYKNTGIRYFNTVTLRPPRCWINGVATSSSRETVLAVKSEFDHIVHSLLLSTTFFFYYQATSNCRDLNPSDITLFPTPDLSKETILDELSVDAEKDYVAKGKIIRMNNKLTGLVELESLTPSKSKPIIDEIDRVLAHHYGFTAEELDFIINYDIKYRMGKDTTDDET